VCSSDLLSHYVLYLQAQHEANNWYAIASVLVDVASAPLQAVLVDTLNKKYATKNKNFTSVSQCLLDSDVKALIIQKDKQFFATEKALLSQPRNPNDDVLMDVTLMYKLLKMAGLVFPNKHIAEKDMTIEACVQRIKNVRDDHFHLGRHHLTDKEFETAWNQVAKGLKGLGVSQKLLKVKTVNLQRQIELKDIFFCFSEMEKEISEMRTTTGDIVERQSSIQTSQGALIQGQKDIIKEQRQSHDSLKSEMADIVSQLKSVCTSVCIMKTIFQQV
jgi:hypothetical protein